MSDDTLRLTLRLKTIDDFFAMPDLSPFDPCYAPYSVMAGIDYVLGEMQRTPHVKRIDLTILLPPAQVLAAPDLETRTREAIGRYAAARMSATAQARAVELRTARTVGGIAVVFFVVAHLLQYHYSRAGSIFGESGAAVDVLMEGISVGAWVALWWPLDLLYQQWQSRGQMRAYRALPHIDLRIVPDPVVGDRVSG
jgi:hypothetical protein